METDNNYSMLTAMQDAKYMFLRVIKTTWEESSKVTDVGKRVRAWNMAHVALIQNDTKLAVRFMLGALTVGLEQLNLLSDEEKVELELDNLD